MNTEKKSNKEKIIDAIFDLLKGGKREISCYLVAQTSGVDVSNVYRIIKQNK